MGSEGSLYLLATCYYRAGQVSRTYSVLKGQTNVDCRYLFARTCFDLKKYQEGELALTGALFPGSNTDVYDFQHTAGAAYALLGDICKAAHREDQAAECYRKSLAQNPFMWTSFVALSDMGTPVLLIPSTQIHVHDLACCCLFRNGLLLNARVCV